MSTQELGENDFWPHIFALFEEKTSLSEVRVCEQAIRRLGFALKMGWWTETKISRVSQEGLGELSSNGSFARDWNFTCYTYLQLTNRDM